MPHTPCPAPCPDWCTREEGHGLRVHDGWRRIHLGEPRYPGPSCLGQGETVADDGTVSRGPLRLDGPHGTLVVPSVDAAATARPRAAA